MYEPFFGFSQRPFAAAPTAKRFFPASSIDAARQMLTRAIDRAEGIGLVIGPPGIGKTVLLQVLADQFRERFATVVFSAGQLETRRELLQAISFDLGLAYQNKDEGELRLGLVDYLARSDKCPQGMLVLVDEAHVLPANVLEELRLMTNLAKDGEPRVRLVLAGTIRLEEQLAQPRLESFSQRLTARCYLDSFDSAESADYVRFQVAVAGGRLEAVFLPEAVTAVHRATDGLPRLINQVCDQALHLAFAQGRRPLDARMIAAAWAELQQLPAPWHDTPANEQAARSDAVIEFGQLSDETDETYATSDALTQAASTPTRAVFDADDTAELAPDVLGELIAGEDDSQSTFSADFLPSTNPDVVRAGVRHALPDGYGRERLLVETSAAFDEIERQVSALEDGGGELLAAFAAPSAAVGATTGATVPPPAIDPFERFEDEELLLDRYATLDSRNKPVAIEPSRPLEQKFVDHSAPSDTEGERAELEYSPEDCDELSSIHLQLSDHAEFFEVVVDPYWELGADAEEATCDVKSASDETVVARLPAGAEFPRAAQETLPPSPNSPPSATQRPATLSLSDAIRRRGHDDASEPQLMANVDRQEPLLKLRAPETAALASVPIAPAAVVFAPSQPEFVVVDDAPDEGSVFDTGRLLERQDYRELFARLKRS